MMQVSNVVSPNVNGNTQISHPVAVGGGFVGGSNVVDSSVVDVQTARNPTCVTLPSDTNETVAVLELVIIVKGVGISPQYLSSSISSQS